MQVLNSYNNSTSDFTLTADALRDKSSIKLVYTITDLKNLLNLPAPFTSEGAGVSREDGLWNHTCFEMFIRKAHQKPYTEFNFSLKPAWNQYSFDSYRLPQPPKHSFDITLQKMNWNGQSLEVELTGFEPEEKFEISLTTVLQERSGKIHYMALKHAGSEADFHHVDSFILKK